MYNEERLTSDSCLLSFYLREDTQIFDEGDERNVPSNKLCITECTENVIFFFIIIYYLLRVKSLMRLTLMTKQTISYKFCKSEQDEFKIWTFLSHLALKISIFSNWSEFGLVILLNGSSALALKDPVKVGGHLNVARRIEARLAACLGSVSGNFEIEWFLVLVGGLGERWCWLFYQEVQF